MSTIVLTGGGTAGHCTPHLAILPYIKNDFDEIYYIGSKNGIERNIVCLIFWWQTDINNIAGTVGQQHTHGVLPQPHQCHKPEIIIVIDKGIGTYRRNF